MAQNEAPKNIYELLSEVTEMSRSNEKLTMANALVAVIRKYHFWPALQVKKFFSEPNLVLLHNTYKRMDVQHFQELYDECRSVILDMSAPEGENIIVTYASSIFDRMTENQYEKLANAEDSCEVTYEGTVITVYNHNGKWFFGTTSCPTVDSSRYFHPTKTHGDMLNEALLNMFPEETTETVRSKFTSYLDDTCAYAFVLVHHDNRHTMDYTEEFGENYAKLVHITTRDRSTLYGINDQSFAEIGIVYPKKFSNPTEAIEAVRSDKNLYGFIATTGDGKRYKVSNETIVNREECDLGNPNKWLNMLWLYMQNKKHYQIVDYLRDFAPGLELPVDSKGNPMSPTYLVHTVICNMRDLIYTFYRDTTTYNLAINRYRILKEADERYDPMIRFHLAQLRHIQISDHAHRYITRTSVYDYICHHHTLKNVRLLIHYFAKNACEFFKEKPRVAECFQVLDKLLTPPKNE
jgi:hypothetical protein